MTRVCVAGGAFDRLRLAVSPLWEVVGSLAMLARWGDELPSPYHGWGARARPALAGAAGTTLLRCFSGPAGRLPPFLVPMPRGAEPSIKDQLQQVRTATADRVREELACRFPSGLPAELAAFHTDPAAALDRYVAVLTGYWRAAIWPYWPAMRAALNEEVRERARTLAAKGPRTLLAGLSGSVRWEPPWLSLGDGAAPQPVVRCDRELILVPLLFARGPVLCAVDGVGGVAVAYQARATALFERIPPPLTAGRPQPEVVPGDRLAILLGRSRANVLRAVTVPTTTSTLAGALGLSASTVSEHLTALLAAGAVQRRRAGVRVLYELDKVGAALLKYFDG